MSRADRDDRADRATAASTSARGARLGHVVVVAAFGIVAAMAIGAGLLAWSTFHERRDDTRDQLGQQTQAAADLIERYVSVRLSVMSSLANLPAVRTGDVDAMRSSLAQVDVPELGLVGGVGFVDRDGMLHSTTDPLAPPVEVGDRSYVRNVLADGEPFVSEAVIGRVTDRPLVVVAVPVRSPADEVIGALVSSLPVEDLGGIVPVPAPAVMRIVDRTGNVIYDGGPVTELAPPAAADALDLSPGSASSAPNLRGEPDRLVAVAEVAAPEWQLTLDADASDVDAAARTAFDRELLIVLTLGVLALIAAVVVGRRTSTLHRSVVRQARRLASLERFTAILAAAATAEDVADAVATLGPAVLDVGQAELVLPARGDPGGATGPEVRISQAADAPPPALLVTLTEQAAQALERVRSRHELDRLAVLSGALSRATTTDEVLAAIEQHGAVVESVTAVTAMTSALAAEPPARPPGREGGPGDLSPRYRSAVVAEPVTPHLAAMRAGEVIEIVGADEIRRRFGAWGEAATTAGAQSLVAVPFVLARSPATGAMTMTFDRPGRLDKHELTLVTTVGRLGADALGRAQLFDQEQHVADTLQASLQPARVPVVAGWRFTGVNLAGEAGVSVGGDWYDVAVLPHGSILLSVGDVTGRGPVAAGVMGIVRSAVHALALSDRDPASILDHADRLLSSSTADQLATAWVGLLDPVTGRVDHASAGHLPPLALGPSAKRYLDEPPGLLLGTGLVGSRRTSTFELEPGASIVAYTDGLCERRDESLDVALRKMAAALGDGSGIDARTVVHRVLGRATPDDVVVLVATRLESTAREMADGARAVTAG